LPTDLWAIQPTGRELTDFKKPMSERVKIKIQEETDNERKL
jgi:hypothetical protein